MTTIIFIISETLLSPLFNHNLLSNNLPFDLFAEQIRLSISFEFKGVWPSFVLSFLYS